MLVSYIGWFTYWIMLGSLGTYWKLWIFKPSHPLFLNVFVYFLCLFVLRIIQMGGWISWNLFLVPPRQPGTQYFSSIIFGITIKSSCLPQDVLYHPMQAVRTLFFFFKQPIDFTCWYETAFTVEPLLTHTFSMP